MEHRILSIYANDIASSTKVSANLLIDAVYVKADDVDKVNGVVPTDEPDENGYYKIERASLDDTTITLKTGSVVLLGPGGVVRFNTINRTGTLSPYDSSDPTTYADEKVAFLVKDVSSNPPAETESIQEFTIRVKGNPVTPSDGLQVSGGPFLVNTYATVEEMPEDYAVVPTYLVDGVEAGNDYVFSLVDVVSSFEEDGEYQQNLSSLFGVGTDGKILIDKEILVTRHPLMGTDTEFATEYYRITVKAVKAGTETERTVEVPVTLRYVAS